MAADIPKWAPRRLRDLIGAELITRYEMVNSMVTIPASATVTVESATAWHKINIVGKVCACCNVRPRMSKIHINDLRLP